MNCKPIINSNNNTDSHNCNKEKCPNNGMKINIREIRLKDQKLYNIDMKI